MQPRAYAAATGNAACARGPAADSARVEVSHVDQMLISAGTQPVHTRIENHRLSPTRPNATAPGKWGLQCLPTSIDSPGAVQIEQDNLH